MESIAELADMFTRACPAQAMEPARGAASGCCGSLRAVTYAMTVGWTLSGLREVGFVHGVRTERHLLRPFDLLVTARTGSVQIALVPPDVSRTVAGVTLLVVRTKQPESGMAHWLWYYLTSSIGRTQLARRMTASASLKSLSAKNLGEVQVPVPSPRDLDTVARLVEASEAAYASAVEAARLRRETLRDSVIDEIGRRTVPTIQRRCL